MKNLRCETVEQFNVYIWIKQNFNICFLTLSLVNSNTLLLDDQEDTAYISYMNETIYIRYSTKYDFKIEKYRFKKPHLT